MHYVIEMRGVHEQDKDFEGTFHITSTWKKYEDQWKLIFNMDSRIQN